MSKRKQQKGKKKEIDWGDSDDEPAIGLPAVIAKKKGGKRPSGPANAFSLLNALPTSDSSSEESSEEDIPQPVKKASKNKKPSFNAFVNLNDSESDSSDYSNDSSDSDSDIELKLKKKDKKSKKQDYINDSDSDSDIELKKKNQKSKKQDYSNDSDIELKKKNKKIGKKDSNVQVKSKKKEETDSDLDSNDELKPKKKKDSKKSKKSAKNESGNTSETEKKIKKKTKKLESDNADESETENETKPKKKSKDSKKKSSKIESESDSGSELEIKSKKKSKILAESETNTKKKSKKASKKDDSESDEESETLKKTKRSKTPKDSKEKSKAQKKKSKSKKPKESDSESDDSDREKVKKSSKKKNDDDGKKKKKSKKHSEVPTDDEVDNETKAELAVEAVSKQAENSEVESTSEGATTPNQTKKRQGKLRPDKAAARAAIALAIAEGKDPSKVEEELKKQPVKETAEPAKSQSRTFVDSEEGASAVASVAAALSKVSFNKAGSAIPTEILDLRFRRPPYADTSGLAVTGTLTSDRNSRDVQIDKFSLQAYGQSLIRESSLNLLFGRKYGLIGANGCGKSSLLQALAWGEVPLPRLVDVFLLDREYDATDLTALDAVMDIVVQEKKLLEDDLEELLEQPNGSTDPKFEYIMERISELDASGSEMRAMDILHGLGFDNDMCKMKTCEFSGGWRMRIALARALFVKPTLLLLDDPSNHLDLGAVVWLEEYLEAYESTILMVSHSQDFLNGVCTDIIHLGSSHLEYYSGNYDTFVRSRFERDQNVAKRARQEEKAVAKMKEAAGRSGDTGKKLAKSKEKALAKKLEKTGGSAIEQVDQARTKPLVIRFNECGGGLAPPVIAFRDVSFGYPGRDILFKDLNIGIDLDSRVALVGPNGAGKSTLMKLLAGVLEPTTGHVTFRNGLRIARFHQHLTEQLDLSQSAVEWMMKQFPQENYKEHFLRLVLGRFGLTGKHQVVAMRQLSDGQRRRVIFSWLSMRTPHLLFLDEPSNHLDLETIDALADGLAHFDGGVVLVSHDFRLIDQVCNEIWVVEDGECIRFEGSIQDYKDILRKRVISSGLGR